MNEKRIMKRLLFSAGFIFAFCMAVLQSGVAKAGNSDYYADLIRSGKFCIVCRIDYGINYNGGNDAKGKESVVILEDREKSVKYFSSYQKTGDLNFLYQILEYQNRTFSDYCWDKKTITPEDVQKTALKEYDKTNPENWGNLQHFVKSQAMSALFTGLADITERNNILKNYKTEYRNSGISEFNGVQYSYDEYAVKAPKEFALRIFYHNGKIFRSVKMGNDQLSKNPFLFGEQMKTDSVDIISFEKFDNDTESMVDNILGRIEQNNDKDKSKKNKNKM